MKLARIKLVKSSNGNWRDMLLAARLSDSLGNKKRARTIAKMALSLNPPSNLVAELTKIAKGVDT